MGYYMVGVDGLYEAWFHGQNHGVLPFDVNDQSLAGLRPSARDAGLAEGDILESLNGRPFTGDAQLRRYLIHARPRDIAELTVRAASKVPQALFAYPLPGR